MPAQHVEDGITRRTATLALVALAVAALCLALAPLAMPEDYSWASRSISESAAQGVQGAWLLAVLRAEQGGAPDEMNLANALFTLGAVHADLGRFDEAARCFGAASAYHTRQGVDSAGRTAPACEQRRDAVITELGARRYDLMAGIGQADPDGVVRRLLTR